jgi:hypothetical protein
MKPISKGAAPPTPAPAPLGAAEWVRQALGFPADTLQASVLDTDAKRGILNCTRQWGKSTVTAAKAVHHAFHRPASLTIVVSPSARQSAEFLRKAAAFTRKLGIRPKGDGDNQISLAFPNESRIVGLPATEATDRGFSCVSLLLIDEAARVSDQLYMSLRPMLAVSAGSLWLMSTPFGKRGFFYKPGFKEVPSGCASGPPPPIARASCRPSLRRSGPPWVSVASARNTCASSRIRSPESSTAAVYSALAEQLNALERLEDRAARSSEDRFRTALAKIPDVEPPEYDRLS